MLPEVIRVTAVDADEGSNAAVTYQIVQGAEGKFIIEGEAHNQRTVPGNNFYYTTCNIA